MTSHVDVLIRLNIVFFRRTYDPTVSKTQPSSSHNMKVRASTNFLKRLNKIGKYHWGSH